MPRDTPTTEKLEYGMNTVKWNGVNTNKAYFIALFCLQILL